MGKVDISKASIELFISDSMEMGWQDNEAFELLRTLLAERDAALVENKRMRKALLILADDHHVQASGLRSLILKAAATGET